ncbi:MAG: hypothetical protein AABW71_03485 [Nanoarchaeota archaeon]
MTYHSLFDIIADEYSTFRVGSDRLSYNGTLDAVLDETEDAPSIGDRRTRALQLALHPPRIIRAFIDYKIQHPSSEVEALLRDAVQLGLDVYKDDNVALEKLKELRRRTIRSNARKVLQRTLKQPYDPITWNATHHSKSKKTAENLALRTNGENVLFVALAHGGVATGMDTYLRYCNDVDSDGSSFYVARFSTHKLWDLTPRLTPAEITYLQEQANGRRPVIFDEDIASGKTLNEAEQFFTGSVFPFGNVVILTNLDAKAELMSLGFGKNLMNFDSYSLEDKHKSISKLYREQITSKIKLVEDNSHIPNKKLNKFYSFLSKSSGDRELCGVGGKPNGKRLF